jgi:enoyl-CoA hydratase
MDDRVVEIDQQGAVGIVTLNRPAKRNAISRALMGELRGAISQLDADPEIAAIILTGADPAFCAGVDLVDFERALRGSIGTPKDGSAATLGMLPPHDTPVIGAINGPTATGGLEIAMDCDFLIASERARFADTHTRVGVMPGGGMLVRLPRLIGIDRARRMSLTGDYIDAATALSWGLVTEVTPHDQLLVRALEIAQSIVAIDPVATRAIRRLYSEVESLTGDAAYLAEIAGHDRWMADSFDAAGLAGRRADIIERGSRQA